MKHALETGAIIGGDFCVRHPLSAGGMGAVYVVEQLSTGKDRALKVMHDPLVDDPALRARFVREARLAAKVRSEHVVEVLAAGVSEDDGAPWIAMELLVGCDLSQLVKRHGPLDLSACRSIVEQTCHGLAAAHDEGIVHRDLKPQNVFLCRLHSAGRPWAVKVLDFGIAKLVADVTHTETQALGSPTWMAPEQTETSSDIRPATDVWALGLVAYWMLTGCVYWNAARADHASLQALLREMLFDDLEPPSRRSRDTKAAIPFPEELDAWFLRCVHRTPAARFAHARDAWEAFAEAVGDDAPPSHVLPPEVASLAAHAQPHRSSPATQETAPGREPADTLVEGRREVATRASPAPLTEEASVTRPDDAPHEVGSTSDLSRGPTLQSHELRVERPSRPQWPLAVAALATGGVGAYLLLGSATSPESDTAALAPTTTTTATSTTTTTMTPPAPAPEPVMPRAYRAFDDGELDLAERLASSALDELGSVVGKRPPDVPESTIGAEAQRLLTRIALARAAEGDFETHFTEATIACGKASSWSSQDAARCCHADLARAALDHASPDDGGGPSKADVERARAAWSAAPRGPTACEADVASLGARLDAIRTAPTGAASTPRPFDAAVAQAELQKQQARATNHCRQAGAGVTKTFRVQWTPGGIPHVAPTGPADAAAMCVLSILMRARVPPFDPTEQPPSTTVAVTLE